MTCQEYLDRLLLGLAEDGAEAGDREHASACASCRERTTAMRAALAGVAAAPGEPPAGFARGAMQRLAAVRAPWEKAAPSLIERVTAWLTPRLVPVACAAAACVMLAVGVSRPGPHGASSVKLARVVSKTGDVRMLEVRGGTDVTVPEGGSVRLAVADVAEVTLTGGAQARIESAAMVRVSEGSATFDVHHDRVGAGGFWVATPHLNAHVTGTQFSVKVAPADTTVELYQGKVELSSLNANLVGVVMAPGERAVGSGTALDKTVSRAAPAWPMLPTATPALPALPSSEPRPVAAATAFSGARPSAAPGAEPVGGVPLPEVSGNANVHEPFRGQ